MQKHGRISVVEVRAGQELGENLQETVAGREQSYLFRNEGGSAALKACLAIEANVLKKKA